MSLTPALPAQRVVVLLGPLRLRWPEPLATALELGELHLESAASLHEAAALLATHRSLRRALLIDPALLTATDIPLLRILKSRLPTPMLFLPLTNAASPAVRHASDLGVHPWHHAEPLLSPPAAGPPGAGRGRAARAAARGGGRAAAGG
ncbi:MAG: hypothetical protein ACTHN5_08300, partial [Phycisphaerae bacterium]